MKRPETPDGDPLQRGPADDCIREDVAGCVPVVHDPFSLFAVETHEAEPRHGFFFGAVLVIALGLLAGAAFGHGVYCPGSPCGCGEWVGIQCEEGMGAGTILPIPPPVPGLPPTFIAAGWGRTQLTVKTPKSGIVSPPTIYGAQGTPQYSIGTGRGGGSFPGICLDCGNNPALKWGGHVVPDCPCVCH